jgi:hypothetical protein
MFAGIPAAWLMRRALLSGIKGMAAIASLVAILSLRPLAVLDQELAASVNNRPWRARLEAEGVRLPNGGRSRVPPDQAKDLEELTQYLGGMLPPSDTFIDFSNEPALYFLLNRRMPTPYLAPSFYEDAADQRKVIAMFEREKPGLAIMSGRGATDNPDGVLNRIRTPLVAEYLASHYRFATEVAGRAVFHRVSESAGDVVQPK